MDSVLVAENGGSLRNFMEGKITRWWTKDKKPITIDEMFGQMLECHVNYLPLGWGHSDYKALEEQRPDLLKKLALRAGYRLIVTEARWPKAIEITNKQIGRSSSIENLQEGPAGGNSLSLPGFTIETIWENTGVGRLPFTRHPGCVLLGRDGQEVARSIATETDVSHWIEGNPYQVDFNFQPGKWRVKPGKYRVAVGIIDPKSEHPDTLLGIEGQNKRNWYTLGELTVH